MLEKGDGKRLKCLYSLCLRIVEASSGHDLKGEEIRTVISIVGALVLPRNHLMTMRLSCFLKLRFQVWIQIGWGSLEKVSCQSLILVPSFVSAISLSKTSSYPCPFYKITLSFQLFRIVSTMNVTSLCYI